LAYPALARPGLSPIFDDMIKNNLLKENMFAFYLTTKKQEEKGLKSSLTLGYYDQTKFTGDIHWNHV